MKNIILITMIVLLIVGCSWTTNLIIANKSSEIMQIEYKLKAYDKQPRPGEEFSRKGYIFMEPKLVSINDLGGLGYANFQNAEYSYDEETGTVRAKLSPGKALFIGTIGNYSGHVNQFWYDHMDIKSICIKMTNKEYNYEGLELLKAFKKYNWSRANHTNYVLIIN